MSTIVYRDDHPVFDHILQVFAGKKSELCAGPQVPSPWPFAEPTRDQIVRLVNTAFWASLLREEGRWPAFSLVLAPPDKCQGAYCFGESKECTPQQLAKLAPAVYPGESVAIGVHQPRPSDGLEIWGFCLSPPPFSFVLRVVEAGHLVAKFYFISCINIALFAGEQAQRLPAKPPDLLLGKLLSDVVDPSGASDMSQRWTLGGALLAVGRAMFRHGHGGTLLVVQDRDGNWRRSITEIKYKANPPFTTAFELLDQAREAAERDWDARMRLLSQVRSAEEMSVLFGGMENREPPIRRALEAVGMLTAVDGAVIVTRKLEVLGFGARIQKRADVASRSPGMGEAKQTALQVLQINLSDHTQRNQVPLEKLGGTRHCSAAEFVHEHEDTVAIVASHDGRVTILERGPQQGEVVALRIDPLLL